MSYRVSCLVSRQLYALHTRDGFIETDVCRAGKVVKRGTVQLATPQQNLSETFTSGVADPLLFIVVLGDPQQCLDHIVGILVG